ncbi:MAG: ATP-binding protein [Fimbriimonadales bacterium]|nr:ATP-binding protein [Fimbriimonadales bacterium]
MFERCILPRLERLLSAMPAVYLQGARQVGKTTLAKHLIARGVLQDYVSMDDPIAAQSARRDPVGFVRSLRKGTVIDEAQRVPEIMSVLKLRIDEQREAGMFLLTGSASPLALTPIADALVGRVGLLTLFPLAQAEIEGAPLNWLEWLYEAEWQAQSYPTADDLAERVVRGGYPEAVLRHEPDLRREWLLSYLDTLIARDVRDLAEVERLHTLPQMAQLLAANPCPILNIAGLSRELGIAQATVQKYLSLFETLFIVYRAPAWYANIGKRLLKAPKLLLNDTGLACALLGYTPARLQQEPTTLGKLLENFVGAELLKLIACSGRRVQLCHLRTEKGVEVDFVLEDEQGRIVGVECKLSATVHADDFRGLRWLQTAVGKRFVRGVVFYRGERALPFGENLWAVSLSALWSPPH